MSKRPPKIPRPRFESTTDDMRRRLKNIVPGAFGENGTLNTDALLTQLGETPQPARERYLFDWAGKHESATALTIPPLGTLMPQHAESVSFGNTQNLYLEGDNLEILKLLRNSYTGRVKMIYIDPPYNTGKDFVYHDNFRDPLSDYFRKTGQIDKNGKKAEAADAERNLNGHRHSRWLSMMYPRLWLANELLRDDGVIFVSIDDNEVHHLRILMNLVFGEDNFIALLPTVMNLKGNQDQFGFAGTHEYTIVCAKNKENLRLGEFALDDELLNVWQKDECGFYKKGASLKATGQNAPREKRPNLYFPLYVGRKNGDYYVSLTRRAKKDYEIFPITDGKEMSWRWSQDKFLNQPFDIIVENGGNNGEFNLYKKQRPSIGDMPSKKPKTLFYKPEYSSGNGTAQLENLLGDGRIVSNPKPVELIKDFIVISSTKNDIILDFFSGSATTAQAVMELNAEDGGARKFIMVQMRESTPDKSEARAAGYDNIAQIGRERIRRAGDKIRQTSNGHMFAADTDLGFRAYSLARGNLMQDWETLQISGDTDKERMTKWDNSQKKLRLAAKRNPEAIITELILSFGMDLFATVQKKQAGKNTVHLVDDGIKNFHLCLDDTLEDDLYEILGLSKTCRLVVRDSALSGNISQSLNFSLHCRVMVI
ncbi:MAG: site-specific DNA-methyltransferase [Gammaproteobacteria bacterium]